MVSRYCQVVGPASRLDERSVLKDDCFTFKEIPCRA